MVLDNHAEFYEYLRGKRVVVVGPSKGSSCVRQGSHIDSFDVVIRIKDTYVKPEERVFLGTRTDVCYTTNPLENSVVTQRNNTFTHPTDEKQYRPTKLDVTRYEHIAWVVSAYPSEERFMDKNTFVRFKQSVKRSGVHTKVCMCPPNKYFEVKSLVNRPFSGFSMLLDVAGSLCSELHVVGMDFYRSGYRASHINGMYTDKTIRYAATTDDGNEGHRPDLMYKYFKYQMMKNDKRITVDDSLRSFLEDDRYDNIFT